MMVKEPDNAFVFNAPWIGPERPTKNNCCFRAVREFPLDSAPQQAFLRIAADSCYRIWLNGEFLGTGPVRGTRGLNYFDTYEVAVKLRKGQNLLAAEVYSPIDENFILAPVTPALRLEIPGIVGTDTEWRLQIAEEYRPDVPAWTIQAGFMEFRDLRLEPAGWERKPNADWPQAVCVANAKLLGKALKARNVPALDLTIQRATDLLRAAEVPAGGEKVELEALSKYLNAEPHAQLKAGRMAGSVILPDREKSGVSLVYDFDREIIGRLLVAVDAPAGTVVDVIYGEELFRNERVQSDFYANPNYRFTDRYILREGENRIGSVMSDRGIKLVQLIFRNFDRPVTLRSVEAEMIRYPYAKVGRFFCSDPLLNKIQEICVETLDVCTTDIFMDCPWRERAFWVNDLVVENRTTLAAFGVCDVHRRAFELAFSQQREDGLVPGLCPAPEKHPMVLPPTNFFLFIMLKDYLLASGDRETVKTYLPNLRRIIDAFEAQVDENGITSAPTEHWNFYDWGFELAGYSFNGCRESMINSLYIIALKLYMEFDGANPEYEARIKRTVDGMKKVFLVGDSGYLVDPAMVNRRDPQTMKLQEHTVLSSQLAHALALATGEFTGETERKFVAALTDPGVHMPEFYLHFFVFRELVRHGNRQEVVNRLRRYWGKAVMTGFPALYEAGVHKFGREAMSEAGSLCHGFGTAPIEFFQTGILGVEALTPGFGRFRFSPSLCDLEFAEGRIPTPNGNIFVRIEKGKTYIRIPEGCVAVRDNGMELNSGEHEL